MRRSQGKSLRELRKLLGLSQREVGQAVGVSAASICRYEQKNKAPDHIRQWFVQNSFYKTFERGKRYYIDKERDWSYEYVMDEGIHHVFRACPGGWIQTYTDAQLTGKRIQEVGDDEQC